MDEAPDTPTRRHRHWRRWIVVALAAGLLWVCTVEGPTVRRARDLQIGQTVAEVGQIMGPYWATGSSESMTQYPHTARGSYSRIYTTTPELWRGSAHHLVWYALGRVGLAKLAGKPGFAVEVRFDANGRVDRIRRGSEVVER